MSRHNYDPQELPLPLRGIEFDPNDEVDTAVQEAIDWVATTLDPGHDYLDADLVEEKVRTYPDMLVMDKQFVFSLAYVMFREQQAEIAEMSGRQLPRTIFQHWS